MEFVRLCVCVIESGYASIGLQGFVIELQRLSTNCDALITDSTALNDAIRLNHHSTQALSVLYV